MKAIIATSLALCAAPVLAGSSSFNSLIELSASKPAAVASIQAAPAPAQKAGYELSCRRYDQDDIGVMRDLAAFTLERSEKGGYAAVLTIYRWGGFSKVVLGKSGYQLSCEFGEDQNLSLQCLGGSRMSPESVVAREEKGQIAISASFGSQFAKNLKKESFGFWNTDCVKKRR